MVILPDYDIITTLALAIIKARVYAIYK